MSSVSPGGALVGRDGELARLGGLLRDLPGGRGSALLIEGEPGIGKSALMRTAAAEAVYLGCQMWWGTGDELGQALPLQPFLEGLQVREPSVNPRRNAITRLLRGEIAADRGADVPAALADQLLVLVAEECAARPTVLVIDDLQWADPASVALWGRLARFAGQVPLLLIGMTRPAPHRDDLLALRRVVGDKARLQLAALPAPAVADLVTALAGGRPDSRLLQLADGAAGNPLYLTELMAALARSSSLRVTEAGTAELTGDSAPGSLSAAIADRLDFVAGPVRDMLRAAALLGMDFAAADLAVVLGRAVPDLIPDIEEAFTVGVLAETGTSLGFRHPLIREALYEELPAPVRAAWHLDAARALAAAGSPPVRVARQMMAAGGPGTSGPVDEWVLQWLSGAADSLIDQAPAVAAGLLARAVAGSPAASARQVWLASRLADGLYRTGDVEQAERVVLRALKHAAEPDVIVDLHWTLAQCRMLAGRAAESLSMLDKAMAAPGLTVRHRARLLVLAARTHSHLGEVDEAGQVAADALAAATEADDNWAMSWALHVLTLVTAARGDMAGTLPLFDQAMTATQADPGLTDLRLLLQLNEAVVLRCLDQYERAFAVASEASHLAAQLGTALRLAQARCALGQLFFDTGRWDDALTEVTAPLEDLQEPGVACCDLGIAAVICFHRGEIDAARRYLAAAAPYAERIGHRVIGALARARSLGYEHDGALPAALAELATGFDDISENLEEVEDLLGDAVRLSVQVGELTTAGTLAARAAALADGSAVPHRLASALYCQGLMDHDATLLLAAADRYRDATRPLLAAKAYEAAAAEFLRADDRGPARAAFVQAVDGYAALGAGADVARVQAAFRPHSIHRGPHHRHRRADSGWDSLTPAEVTVAVLVGEGLSNPDIAAKLVLSKRTVDTHVSHILKKLDVASRTGIALEAARRPGTG